MQSTLSGLEATSTLYIESKLDGTTASITPRANCQKDAWADRQSQSSCTENEPILRQQHLNGKR